MSEKHNAYMRDYYKKNPEKIKARVKLYRDNNKEKAAACSKASKGKNKERHAAYSRDYRKKNKERLNGWSKEWARAHPERRKEINRNCRLKKYYGITLDQYNQMLTAQGGGCAVCHCPPESTHTGTLAVDHCHTSGAVRGILCDRCNRALGLLKDDPVRVASLLKYLAKTF